MVVNIGIVLPWLSYSNITRFSFGVLQHSSSCGLVFCFSFGFVFCLGFWGALCLILISNTFLRIQSTKCQFHLYIPHSFVYLMLHSCKISVLTCKDLNKKSMNYISSILDLKRKVTYHQRTPCVSSSFRSWRTATLLERSWDLLSTK